jgi:hypothetical protein
VESGAAEHDYAYAIRNFGGQAGVSGRVWIRDVCGCPPPWSPPPGSSRSNTAGELVYRLYVDSRRAIKLWIPAGGRRANSINVPTSILTAEGPGPSRIEDGVATGSPDWIGARP